MPETMEQKIIWHPYPTERPGDYFEFSKLLLVTCVHRKTGHAIVWTMWSNVGGGFSEDDDMKVVAWAEMPAPYVPEPQDTHQDAEIARKYVERDPEALRQLGLFD